MQEAAYLAAHRILCQDFAGERLDLVIKKIAISKTSLWPYLRFRRAERDAVCMAYSSSFLSSVFGKKMPISGHLATSPNCPEQGIIVLRYVIHESFPDELFHHLNLAFLQLSHGGLYLRVAMLPRPGGSSSMP
jgi:hypothetical protein